MNNHPIHMILLIFLLNDQDVTIDIGGSNSNTFISWIGYACHLRVIVFLHIQTNLSQSVQI